MFETREIPPEELNNLLLINESHFIDFKSKKITPSKLQETFVAFANADGGDIYVGIEDKRHTIGRIQGYNDNEEANDVVSTLLEKTNPSVENCQLEFIKTKNNGILLHISIPKSPKVHYTASGDCYLRINASSQKIKGDRITSLSYSKGAEPYEKTAIDSVKIEEITSSPHLLSYISRIGSTQDPETFIRKQRLTSEKNGKSHPNVCCVLLYDDDPQAAIDTRSAIKVYRLRTSDTEYKRENLAAMPKTINGPVEDIITSAIDEIKRLVENASYYEGDALVKLRYPAEAIKEILVNAVIHRDYSINDDIHVKVYDNRIEISSPGKLPGFMTISNLYSERFSRNPNLVRMLHKLPNPLNHDIGEGLDTAKNELRKAGLVEPEFEEKGNFFYVTIKHQKLASIEDVIISYLTDNPDAQITNKLVRQLSGEDDINKVKKALQRLRRNGKILPVDKNSKAFEFKYIKGNW